MIKSNNNNKEQIGADMNSIEKALEFTKQKHEGQLRKNGSPYYHHPLAVSNRLKEKGYGIDYQMAGLFHDLLEDTDAMEEEILELSNEIVLEAVKLVTKSERVPESEYIAKILENPIAKAVKNEDRIHNLEEALHGDPAFVKRYLEDTRRFYVGRFSTELDEMYERLELVFS